MSLPSKKPNTSLGEAKITPPTLCDVVPRTSLLRRLKKAKDRHIIYIIGKAAQGKYNLASSYDAASNELVAWLDLGPEDSEFLIP